MTTHSNPGCPTLGTPDISGIRIRIQQNAHSLPPEDADPSISTKVPNVGHPLCITGIQKRIQQNNRLTANRRCRPLIINQGAQRWAPPTSPEPEDAPNKIPGSLPPEDAEPSSSTKVPNVGHPQHHQNPKTHPIK